MLSLYLRTVAARAYPRIAGVRRQPSWIINETILPLLSVSAFVYVYRAMAAPEEYIGYVILGGAMTAFWLNVLWSLGAQLYWERSSGNLELFILAPTSMIAVMAGMVVGGMTLTSVRAAVIFLGGIFLFDMPFNPTSWPLLILAFSLTLIALYGMGMMFASLFLLWGREAFHAIHMLQEPVYLLSGMNFPLKIFPAAVATCAAIIPLTMGMDAMRQLIFGAEGFWPLTTELVALTGLGVLFLSLAYRLIRFIERKARETGRLTVKWQ